MAASPDSKKQTKLDEESLGRRLRRQFHVARAEWIPMKIVVFAEHFKHGDCESWEHSCSARETKAVMDSALAKARSRSLTGQPTHNDFLEGVREVFNTTRGAMGSPAEGDLQVYCVCIDETVIGLYEKICHYSQLATEAPESREAVFQMSA